MTIIEFLDKSHIDNICSALICSPERVIFVSNKKNGIGQEQLANYKSFFEKKGINVEFLAYSLNPFNVKGVIRFFSEITEKYENCVFDLTGGNESYIVGAATVCERFPERHIQLHRYSVSGGTVTDLDADGITILNGGKLPELTVAENIEINGGKVVYETDHIGGTHIWDDSVLEDGDVAALWKTCRKNPTAWNTAVGVCEKCVKSSRRSLLVRIRDGERMITRIAQCPESVRAVFHSVSAKGLAEITDNGDCDRITFKTDVVEKCMSKSGNLLELQVYIFAKKARKNEAPVYTDVLTGVVIDIDGEEDNAGPELTNEIDVILQKGIKTVFISCKNGTVETDELYKLKTVTKRFGGKYANAVLVLGAPRGEMATESLKKRAGRLDIRVIEAYKFSDSKLQEKIAKLAN